MDSKLKRKIIIRANIEILTGLHIGGSNAYSAIGTVDSPVIRSVYDGKPIIPGSSLKGKLRTLLASVKDNEYEYRDHKKDNIVIKRLFGAASFYDKNTKKTIPAIMSQLQFSDAYIKNAEGRKQSSFTEVKFENTITRSNGVANPRQIERVVPGTVFESVIVYNELNPDNTETDMKILAEGMKLLQNDYLGGHGTRGYGRISFKNISIEIVNGDNKDSEIIKSYFNEVENSELLHL